MTLDTNNIEFQTALELIQETNQSFFLTGKAGTGKSTFLKHIVETVSKDFVVVAPTGIAAVNVGGVTIHSFFQFPLRPLLPEDEDIKIFWKDSEKRKIISAMDTLIIDEISMVRADLIDGIDYSLRKNGGNPNLPFGGKQVVFVGDIFQLEPVTIKNSGEQKIISEIYGSAYFYNAKVFERVSLFTVELQKVYRQTDSVFISLLDKVRVKEISQTDLNKINTRVFSQSELNKNDFAITLTTKNDLADTVNFKKISELKTDPFTYNAEVSGEFEESKYPTEPELTLKVGAQVIFIKNDTDKRWVNGTIGQVSGLTDTEIKVKLKDGEIYSVEKRIWENIKYQYNKEKKKIEQEIVGTFKQYPLKLAWAITIHKSQGLTFDKVVVDFGSGTFASGQAYVALSRATSFEGLFLKQKLNSTDIYIDDEIKEFAKTFNDQTRINESLIVGKKVFKYQKNSDNERIGDLYFKNAITNIENGNFKSAYSELLAGFENVSCDCALTTLIESRYEQITLSLKSNSITCSLSELDFIRAVIYYFPDSGNFGQEQKGIYKRALPLIDSYLDDYPNSEIGHYLKGRVLSGLENFEEAISEFEFALSIKETPRVHYRIGRIKEQKLQQFGIDNLYKSILQNPSSLCSLRWFKDCCDSRGIKLQTNTHKLLANFFNNKNTDEFRKAVNQLLLNGTVSLTENRTLNVLTAFEDFLSSLKADENLFGVAELGEDEEGYEPDYDDYDDYDDYSPSYDKYGGAYGYDDDTIDSAFEGDPENYWNID
jgi:tetratricopeptide (TPR) repeat protein